MNIKKTITTIALAGTLALTGATANAQYIDRPGSEANTSETGITRTSRSSSRAELRGEGEWSWANYQTYDLLMVTRIDMGSDSAAEYGVRMIVDGDLLEESGFDVDGTFRIRDIDGCEGVNVSTGGMDAYVVACADDGYVTMIVATDKDVALDTAEDMQDGYEPVAPEGYVEWEG